MTPDPVAAARQTLADLVARARDLADHQADLSAAAEEASYGALVARDPAARKQLDTVHKALLTNAIDQKSVASAMAEARRRVAAAEAAAARAELRARAEAAAALLDDLDDQGRRLSASMDDFAAAFRRFEEIGAEIAKLGMGFPHQSLVKVNAARAVDSALWALRIGNRPIPPAQRINFAELVAHWRDAVAARAAMVLGDDPDHEEAA